MNIKTPILLIFFTCEILGCKNSSKAFIEKFGNNSFVMFENKGVTFRNFVSKDEACCFVNPDVSLNSGVYVVTINIKSMQVVYESCHLLRIDSMGINKSVLNNLAKEFLKYHIHSLYIGANSIVYVNTNGGERANLIRFPDLKYKTEEYKNWKHLKDNWYENQ